MTLTSLSMALGRDQALGQAGVQTAVEEVGQRNMLRLRLLAHRPLGKVAVGDDQVNIRRQVIDCAVGDRDVAQPGILRFLAQYPAPSALEPIPASQATMIYAHGSGRW